MRLQKFLSRAGVCSRREGEDLMRQGRVEVNGEVCRELGAKVDPSSDTVEVDGRTVQLPSERTYMKLHKPEGYVTTTDDPRGRPTVMDLLPEETPRVWPVGRLDLDSSGLIVMTNDGDLTHRLTHPSYEARKRYRVELDASLDADDPAVQRLRDGVELEDGYVTEPADIEVLETRRGSTLIEITLTEGKNRQIRRMADAVDTSVQDLRRVAVGPVELDGLEPGDVRKLTDAEVRALHDEVDAQPPPDT